MNEISSGRILGAFLFCLSGCGLINGIDETKKAVDLTNATSTGILEQIQRTNALMLEMLQELQSTKSAIHLQTLATAFAGLLAPENTAVLTPPLRMMPFAQAYADEAKDDELIKAVHVLYKEALYSPPEANAMRLISLTAMSALAAFASEEDAVAILDAQVTKQGKYEEAAYAFAVGRYAFLRDFLLGSILDNAKYLNKAILVEALDYFESLKFLATVSYLDRLVIDIPSLEVSIAVDPAEVDRLGRKGYRRFTEKLSASELQDPEVLAMLSLLNGG